MFLLPVPLQPQMLASDQELTNLVVFDKKYITFSPVAARQTPTLLRRCNVTKALLLA
jgi:hypothetical protein